MSHHQSRGDRSDSQQKRSSRPARPSVTSPLPSQAASSKRFSGANGQPRGHSPASHESDIHRAQQSVSQHQGQLHGSGQPGIKPFPQTSNGNVPRSFRPVTPSSSENAPDIPKPESAWTSASPQLSFQFGSIGATTYMHTGIQIPARTSSAPPNLDEQKQDQARYEPTNTNATVAKAYGTSGQKSQVQQSAGPQHSFRPKQPPAPLSTAIPQSPYIQNQPQHHTVPANTHVQVQTNSQHLQMQAHLVPPQAQQQGLVQIPFTPIQFPQSMAGSQMLGQQLGSLPVQMPPHQLSGALPTQLLPPYGMFPPQNHFIQPRTNRAVKIVHPETHEELKFDSKSVKNAENSFSSSTSVATRGRMTGSGPHSGPSMSYALRHTNQNIYASQKNGSYSPRSQNYHPSTVSSGIGHTKQNSNETFHDQAMSSPRAATGNIGSANAENFGVPTTVIQKSQGTTQPILNLLSESKNSNSGNLEKITAASISEVSGQVKEGGAGVEERKVISKAQTQESTKDVTCVQETPKDGPKAPNDAVRLQEQPKAAQEAKPNHVSLKDELKTSNDAVRVHEQPQETKEVQSDHISLKDELKALKDAVKLHEQTKEAQEHLASSKSVVRTEFVVPEVKQGGKKKKKKDPLSKAYPADVHKVSKVQVEGKKQVLGKMPLIYNVKNITPKSEWQADDNAAVPSDLKEVSKSVGKLSESKALLSSKSGIASEAIVKSSGTESHIPAVSEIVSDAIIKSSESEAVMSPVISEVASEVMVELSESELRMPVMSEIASKTMVDLSESETLIPSISEVASESMVKLSASESEASISIISEVVSEPMVKSSESEALEPVMSKVASEAIITTSESEALIPVMSEIATEPIVELSESDALTPPISEVAFKDIVKSSESEALIPSISEVDSEAMVKSSESDRIVSVKSPAHLIVHDNHKTEFDVSDPVNNEGTIEGSTLSLDITVCDLSLDPVMNKHAEDNANSCNSTATLEISMSRLNLEPVVSKPAEDSASVQTTTEDFEMNVSGMSLELVTNKPADDNTSSNESMNLEPPSQSENLDEKLAAQIGMLDSPSIHSNLLPTLDTSSRLKSTERDQSDNVIDVLPTAIEDNIQTSKVSEILSTVTCTDMSIIAHNVTASAGDVNSVNAFSFNGGVKLEHNTSKPQQNTKIHLQLMDVSNSVPPLDTSNDNDSSRETQIAADIRPGAKKKKMKDILAKADAAGSIADLYNAYKAPEENKSEMSDSKRGSTSSQRTEADEQVVTAEENVAPKELDDWEDAAELPTPNSSTGTEANSSSKSGEKAPSNVIEGETYTRDFLLTFKDQNTGLPSDFEVRPDIIDLLVNPQLASQQPPRMLDRQPSGNSRRGIFDDDKWARQPQGLHSPAWPQPQGLHSPAWPQPQGLHSPIWQDNYMDFGFPSGFRPGGAHSLIPRMPSNVRPGISAVPMSPGLILGKPSTPSPIPGMARSNTVDSDKWHRIPPGQKGLIPSPHTSAPTVHKAEKRYEVGKASDEEEVKQRQIKGILNKLTPQNFDKLFDKVNDVNIQSAVTLNGVISQIFDKALTEPTFCEMYAKFCKQLATKLPVFGKDDEKITFKRVLLNKCQEEFERGEREEAEATEAAQVENGKEMTAEEREEKRVQAKRRMLGNIRFIGELYKKQMLTERIMHECIRKLLGEYDNPEEEDVEALCKLVSTIGHMIDQAKAKEHMDSYFDRMDRLSNNLKLSSRIRFMLRDVIDLRLNDWQVRRKVEGPKKIEEVHRDAVQERQATVAQAGRFSRASSMVMPSGRRMAPLSDSGIRGPSLPMFSPTIPSGGAQAGGIRGVQQPTGGRGSFAQDVRIEERLLFENRPAPIPLSQRSVDEAPITLGPQGGLGRGIRGQPEIRRFGPASMPAYSSSVPVGAERPLTPPDRPILNRPDKYASGSSNRSSLNLERTLSDRAISTPTSLATNNQQQSSKSSGAPLFMPLDEDCLKEQSKAALVEYFSAQDQKEVIRCIEDLREPKFYSTMVYIWTSIALERKEPERELFMSLLVSLCKSEPFLLKQDQVFQAFEMAIENLEDIAMDVPKAPQYLIKMFNKVISERVLLVDQVLTLIKATDLIQDLDIIREETDKDLLLDLRSLEQQLAQHLSRKEPVSETQKWLEQNVTSQMQSDPSFLRMLMTQVLSHAVPSTFEKEQHQGMVKERLSEYKTLLRKFGTNRDKQSQYILAMQLFIHDIAHPPGLMTTLCNTFYEDEVISEAAYVKWEDDVKDTTQGREQALRDVFRWLIWLKTAPEQS